jgi:hypothetical protein
MSESINTDSTKPAGSTDAEDLKKTCSALESEINTLRIVVIIAVFILAAFFLREGNLNAAAAKQMLPQVSQISQYMAALEKSGSSYQKQMQVMQDVAARLMEYGKRAPDYQPILAKYGLAVAPAQAAPAAKPAGTPAAAPKK